MTVSCLWSWKKNNNSCFSIESTVPGCVFFGGMWRWWHIGRYNFMVLQELTFCTPLQKREADSFHSVFQYMICWYFFWPVCACWGAFITYLLILEGQLFWVSSSSTKLNFGISHTRNNVIYSVHRFLFVFGVGSVSLAPTCKNYEQRDHTYCQGPSLILWFFPFSFCFEFCTSVGLFVFF